MPKKPDSRPKLDDLGAGLMKEMIALDQTGKHATAVAELRSCIYHLTLAKLWITCPDEMADAEDDAHLAQRKPLIKNELAGNGPPKTPPVVTR